MTVIYERLILQSFAIWAEDYLFLNSIFEDKSNDIFHTNEKDSIFHLFKSIEKENFKGFQKKQKFLTEEFSKKQYSIIETDHIRATIWKITDFEYCMRAYLKKLEWRDTFFSRVDRMQSNNKNDLPAGHKYGGVLIFGRKNNCIIRIDEMGLMEGTYYICERDPRRKRQKVLQTFKRTLRNFKDGPVNTPSLVVEDRNSL